jgi:ketosteroid isomerase-like protein
MSQEKVELIGRVYDVANQTYKTGDLTELNDLLDQAVIEEIVLKPSGRFPAADEWRGHEGMRQFMVDQMEAFEAGTMWAEPQEYIDSGDKLIALGRFGGRARHTGIEVEFEFIHMWKISETTILRLDMFASKDEALEAAGLRE